MHPPVAALLWLIFAPPLLLLGGRIGLLLAGLSALAAMWVGPVLASTQAVLLGSTAALALAFLARPRQREHLGALLWIALVTLPLWSPTHPIAWHLWPVSVLAGEGWDPARGSLLYEKWGSAMALPETPFWAVWLVWLSVTLVARAVAASMVARAAGNSPPTA